VLLKKHAKDITPCVCSAFLAMTAQLMKQKGSAMAPTPQQRDRKRVSLAHGADQGGASGGCCG